jgi:hypothetical protein
MACCDPSYSGGWEGWCVGEGVGAGGLGWERQNGRADQGAFVGGKQNL